MGTNFELFFILLTSLINKIKFSNPQIKKGKIYFMIFRLCEQISIMGNVEQQMWNELFKQMNDCMKTLFTTCKDDTAC